MDKEYEVNSREVSFITLGGCFQCVFGKLHYGSQGYVAIINWGVSAEIACDIDVRDKVSAIKYNTEQIYKALSNSTTGQNYFHDDDTRYKISNELAEKIVSKMLVKSQKERKKDE